jgi:hypothetical protein
MRPRRREILKEFPDEPIRKLGGHDPDASSLHRMSHSVAVLAENTVQK